MKTIGGLKKILREKQTGTVYLKLGGVVCESSKTRLLNDIRRAERDDTINNTTMTRWNYTGSPRPTRQGIKRDLVVTYIGALNEENP